MPIYIKVLILPTIKRYFMNIYEGKGLKDGPVTIKDEEGRPLFELSTFIPDAGLIESVNIAWGNRWPLLITGEKYRRDDVAKAIAYEMHGNDFLQHYTRWMLPHKAKAAEGLYLFDHEQRKRDLEYHQLDPEHSPIHPPEFYYQEGPLLSAWKALEELPEVPIIEIRNVHDADENFIKDLMNYLLMLREVRVPEIDFVFNRQSFSLPFIIMTAEPGFQFPNNYDGIVYTHEMKFPHKKLFLEETLATVGAWVDAGKVPHDENGFPDESQLVFLRDHEGFPQLKIMIEKLVDLFYLIKDSSLLQPGNTKFPMSVLELRNTINFKARRVLFQGDPAEKEIEEIDRLLEAQYQLAQSADLSKVVSLIKNSVESAQMNDAMQSLSLVKGQLAAEFQNEASQLIARHHELKQKETMGTESSLFLYPQKNKLMYDLLQFLDQL